MKQTRNLADNNLFGRLRVKKMFLLLISAFQIVLGTLDVISSSDVEWVYKPYMNTTKKRKFLTD